MIMGEKSSKLYHPHFSNITRLPLKCHLLTVGEFFSQYAEQEEHKTSICLVTWKCWLGKEKKEAVEFFWEHILCRKIHSAINFPIFDELRLVTGPILRVETMLIWYAFLGIMCSSNVLQGCADVHSALIPYASSPGCLAHNPWANDKNQFI